MIKPEETTQGLLNKKAMIKFELTEHDETIQVEVGIMGTERMLVSMLVSVLDQDEHFEGLIADAIHIHALKHFDK